jgi:hypothetical protein
MLYLLRSRYEQVQIDHIFSLFDILSNKDIGCKVDQCHFTNKKYSGELDENDRENPHGNGNGTLAHGTEKAVFM